MVRTTKPVHGGDVWGKMAHIRGIISYQLSPHEQAVSSVVFPKFGNTVKRIAQQTPWVLPPFVIGYGIYVWAKAENLKLARKDRTKFPDV